MEKRLQGLKPQVSVARVGIGATTPAAGELGVDGMIHLKLEVAPLQLLQGERSPRAQLEGAYRPERTSSDP